MSLLKLHQMIDSGKTYYYRDQTAVVKSFESRSNGYEVVVDIYGKPQIFIKETEEKISLWLECFKEVPVAVSTETVTVTDALPVRQQKYVPDLYVESKGSFKSLTDILMSDIDKVRTDPSYVSQAKQVCNNVSAIVNITKLQIQLLQNR